MERLESQVDARYSTWVSLRFFSIAIRSLFPSMKYIRDPSVYQARTWLRGGLARWRRNPHLSKADRYVPNCWRPSAVAT